jgi:hypothetical protein
LKGKRREREREKTDNLQTQEITPQWYRNHKMSLSRDDDDNDGGHHHQKAKNKEAVQSV